MASDRDQLAGIKLLGAILRLREFTAAELADFAGVRPETARSFLRPDKGPGFVEAVSASARQDVITGKSMSEDADAIEGPASGQSGRTGRPSNVYRLAPGKKDVVLKKLADYRRSMEFDPQAAITDLQDSAEEFTPVSLLEASLTAFDVGKVTESEEWQDRIQQARIYVEGARADVQAMVKSGVDADTVRQSAERFGIAQGRLAAVERIGPPKDATTEPNREKPHEPALPWVDGLEDWLRSPLAHARTPRYVPRDRRPPHTPKISYVDLLNPFVKRFGKWAGGDEVGMFDPVVVLFDGVKGRDPMSTWLIKVCESRGVRVAVIDLLKAGEGERFTLYGAIDRLRATTPLALADVVMTMDSDTGIAGNLAAEVKDLGIVGAWAAKLNWDELVLQDFAKLDLDALRAFFVAKGAEYATVGQERDYESPIDAQKRLHACRVVSALSAVTAVHAAEAAASLNVHVSPLPGDEPENQPSELRATASRLMGNLFCFDFAHSAAIEKDLSGAAVTYVPRAVEHIKSGTWQSQVSARISRPPAVSR